MPMRVTKSVSITMPVAMVKDAERLAKRENRTMSELVREALRHYATSRRTRSDRGTSDGSVALSARRKESSGAGGDLSRRQAAGGLRSAPSKKLGFKERDTVRMIHESRARRNAS